MLQNINLRKATAAEHLRLLAIWESSVRATHHFLSAKDLLFYKEVVAQQALPAVDVTCAVNDRDIILGFSGVSDQSLEMLFVDANSRGSGIGKLLLQHAIDVQGITRVDVNEQNEQAYAFYGHFGFKMVSRSGLDGMGKPYPILHLELMQPS